MREGLRWASVVLAAGSARRFGGGKLLAGYQGRPLLHGALAAARAAPVETVIVVTGADADAVAACALGFDPALTLVHAADHDEGMAASLRAGVAAVPDGLDGAFVFLGDMPRVPHAVLAPMAAALADGGPAVAPEFEGRRGNPVLLGRALFGEVAELTGDQGARPILQRLGGAVVRIQAPDDGVLFDVDAPQDLQGR